MKKITLLFAAITFSLNVFPQAPAIQWQKCLGGTNQDGAYSMQQTSDGGYIVGGYANSNNGDVTGNHGLSDYWVVKLNGSGILQWQKCLGGTNSEWALCIQQTTDGGYIVAGMAESNDGDITGNHGIQDYWVVRLDSSGILQWQKCLGGTDYDRAYSIQQTADGGYVVAGWAMSNDGDVTGNYGFYDYWVVKLDSSGTLQWQKCLGGTNDDYAWSIEQTADGGYIVAGIAESNNGDVTGHHGSGDYWVVKLDGSGILQWQKCLGGTNNDRAYSIQQTADGGCIVAGGTLSIDGDVTGNHGDWDYWVVKLDGSGTLQWEKCLGGTSYDYALSIRQTADGGYIAAGTTMSNDGDITGNHGGEDYWVVKLDSSGILQWQKCLGGTNNDGAYSIQQTADGSYVVAGEVISTDGDVTGNHGDFDYWVVKLSSMTGIEEYSTPALQVYPNLFSNSTTISFSLSQSQNISLKIFDVNGRLVSTLTDKIFEEGEHQIEFNAEKMDAGIYFLRMETINYSENQKLIVAK